MQPRSGSLRVTLPCVKSPKKKNGTTAKGPDTHTQNDSVVSDVFLKRGVTLGLWGPIADFLEARFSFIVTPCLTSLAVMASASIWGQGAADVVGA